MKNLILILISIFASVNIYSQNYDLIINTKGDSIVCRIDSTTDSNIYFKMKYKGEWIHTNYNRNAVVDYQFNVISKKENNRVLKFVSNLQLPPEDEINISTFFGFSLFGPNKDIESGMKIAGLDATTHSDNFFGEGTITTEYPHTRRNMIWDLNISYFYTKKSGISFNTGLEDGIKVFGCCPDFNLKSTIWFYSLTYNYSSKNKRSNFYIGPAYFTHKITVLQPQEVDGDILNSKKLGFNLGYSFHIIQKNYFFLTIKTSYKWAPDSEIGPYSFIYSVWQDNATNLVTVNYPATKVSMGCLNIGLSIGFRIRKK